MQITIESCVSKLMQKETKDLVSYSYIYCPFCQRNVVFRSEYLYETFVNQLYVYWIASLVTHYRHDHIRYWDRSWSNSHYRSKIKGYNSYEEYKKVVNNRAKRQIIREIQKDIKLSINQKRSIISAVLALQHNDQQTIDLITRLIK